MRVMGRRVGLVLVAVWGMQSIGGRGEERRIWKMGLGGERDRLRDLDTS